MRNHRNMTDEQRLSLLSEYEVSGMSKRHFEEEKGLSNGTISKWLRNFAIEDTSVSSQKSAKDMKHDPDKEELLDEITRLKQESIHHTCNWTSSHLDQTRTYSNQEGGLFYSSQGTLK